MALPFFQNSINSGMTTDSDTYFREMQQAVIDDQWDNTSSMYTVLEQADIGSDEYNEVEAWVNYVAGQSSTGVKNGTDFKQFTFRDITHRCIQGLYYQFDDNYYLAYFTDDYASLTRFLAARRCNNVLRWKDPENGSIVTVPCVIDYEMSSPSTQVTQTVLTPNNHATIMVQGNEQTLGFLDTNKRFIFGTRVFKITGYQNELNNVITDKPTLLYYDMYLDEKQVGDDFVTGIAYNGEYDYSIIVPDSEIELATGSTGIMRSQATLNGSEVDRTTIWATSDDSVIEISESGVYSVVGVIGDTAILSCSIEGSEAVTEVSVTLTGSNSSSLVITPEFGSMREFQEIEIEVEIDDGATLTATTGCSMSLSDSGVVLSDDNLTITKVSESSFILSCTKRASEPKKVYVADSPSGLGKTLEIQLTSMMG